MKIDGDPTWGRDPQVGNRCCRQKCRQIVDSWLRCSSATLQAVVRDLVKRYIIKCQRAKLNRDVTEDDINEIKQDISSFRYELLDVLGKNGMKLPTNAESNENNGMYCTTLSIG